MILFEMSKAIRERAKKAAANRKNQHGHLMENLAPHTKRLAETAIGGSVTVTPAMTGNNQQQQQQASGGAAGQQRANNLCSAGGSGTNSTSPATISSGGGHHHHHGNSSGGAVGALAGTLLSSAPGVTLAKTTLLGRTASTIARANNKQRRRSLFEEDKITDQGSGSQVR